MIFHQLPCVYLLLVEEEPIFKGKFANKTVAESVDRINWNGIKIHESSLQLLQAWSVDFPATSNALWSKPILSRLCCLNDLTESGAQAGTKFLGRFFSESNEQDFL